MRTRTGWLLAVVFTAATFVAVVSTGCRAGDSETRAAPERAKVEVGTIHQWAGDGAEESIRVESPGGGLLEIEEAYIVVSAVELHACVPGRDGYDRRGRPLLNGLFELAVPPVRAHVPSSTTRLGTPFVDDLVGRPGRAQIAGALAPPYGAYCRAYAVVAPADRDVVNSTPLATDEIVGASVVVRGRQRGADAEGWRPFEIRGATRQVVGIDVVDPATGEGPLVVTPEDSSAMVLFEMVLDGEVFAVDPEADDAAETVVEQVADRTSAYTY